MKARKRVGIFIGATVCVLLIAPAVNLTAYFSGNQNSKYKNPWRGAVLYNMDVFIPLFSRALYGFGISISPEKVVIGHDQWLFLGDQYERTLSVTREGPGPEGERKAKAMGLAAQAWNAWFHSHGVRLYRIMLGPNKTTIYPEYLPSWVQPAPRAIADALDDGIAPALFSDPRKALMAAKSKYNAPLFYKTDTHWNDLAGWIAYRTFAEENVRLDPSLRWLGEGDVVVTGVRERSGGDLANFLRLMNVLRDEEVEVSIRALPPINVEQYDYASGSLTASGGNPRIGAPEKPLLVKSAVALNKKKVLWLRDSFGMALAPYMAATFSETLQLHFAHANPAVLAQLVERYQPDYVFITVVERAALSDWFVQYPPTAH